MTHSHRRTNANTGAFPTIPPHPDITDHKASRVRSNEDKTHAALQAQRRAAANREEVLRDTAHLAEGNDRHARDQTHRQSSRSRYTAASNSQDNPNSNRGQMPRGVRFTSPATQQESVKHMSPEQTGSSKDRPRDHKPAGTSESSHPSHSWTSRLKTFTSFSQKDNPPRTEMHTTTFHNGHHHRHRRRPQSTERVRPQPAHPHATADTNVRSTNHEDRHGQPPLTAHHVSNQSHPFHQPAPQSQHYIHSKPSQRINVYLSDGPSDWHVTGGHAIPMPEAPPYQQAHAAPAQHGQPYHFPPQSRQTDFFGQVAMHGLQNVQNAAQYHHQQQPYPPAQPQQHGHVERTTQHQSQAQGQAQPATGEEKPATYPVPKNRMPVWNDQSQCVRWEWR